MKAAGFQDLLRQAQAEDKSAMDRILVLLRPHLERVARSCLEGDESGASASDVVQESWMRAWTSLGQFAGGSDDAETLAMFRAWATRIVRNVCLRARRDLRRKKRRAPHGRLVRLRAPGSGGQSGSTRAVDLAASGSTPSSGVRHDEEARQIRAALESLADTQEKEIVRLRFFEGLTLRAIADRLGLTYDQARERFHRGMGHLGAQMRRLS